MPPSDAHSFWLVLMQRVFKTQQWLVTKKCIYLDIDIPSQKKKKTIKPDASLPLSSPETPSCCGCLVPSTQ